MAVSTPYAVRTLQAIREQCVARGLPPEELESVLAHLGDHYGERVQAMDEGQLRRVNRELEARMRECLGGHKRRGEEEVAAVNATDAAVVHAVIHGLDVTEIEGTGSGGQVTKGDVERHLADS